MRQYKSKKCVVVFLIAAFGLFMGPFYLGAQEQEQPTLTPAEIGVLIGHVYFQNGKTPVKGAIVQVRMADTALVFKSGPSDSKGAFTIEGLPAGLYAAGVTYKKDDYNVETPFGISAAKTTEVDMVIGRKKGSPILLFFTSTAGLALIAASSVGIAMAVVNAAATRDTSNPDDTSSEVELSAFR